MIAPERIAKNQPFIIIIGGEYAGSMLDASRISSVEGPDDKIVTIALVGHRTRPSRREWNWCRKDIKWRPIKKLTAHGCSFITDYDIGIDSKTREAIKKYNGAWVVCLRI